MPSKRTGRWREYIMSTAAHAHERHEHWIGETTRPATATRFLVPIGRACFAAIFLKSAPNHFTPAYAAAAAQHGVPLASILVPLSGVLALAGGLSVLLGYRARIGAWLLVAFLVPVTLMMHNFWAAPPQMAQMQQGMFMKNLAMLGGALLMTYFGAGPVSLDKRGGR
jgi:putative oxidoreductase